MLSHEMKTRLRQIGKNLQIARKRRNKTVQQAAEMMGTSLSSVRRMEAGNPSVRVETYLAALEVYQLDRTLRFAEPEEESHRPGPGKSAAPAAGSTPEG